MVDGDTVEGTRYFVGVNDPTKPEDLLYGPELVDITSEMDAIWVAMVEDITADESAAMEEFHRTYTEDEDNGVEHMSEEMCMDYDNNQRWLNDYGYHMIRHMESVVPAATDDRGWIIHSAQCTCTAGCTIIQRHTSVSMRWLFRCTYDQLARIMTTTTCTGTRLDCIVVVVSTSQGKCSIGIAVSSVRE